jgi:hypothetical protein
MKWSYRYFAHLAKRTWQSYRAVPLTDAERSYVVDVLLSDELALWDRFPVEDQRHSLIVLKRFEERGADIQVEHRRAALLHDIGKIVSPLSTTSRVIATFVGPRTAAFRAYHDHENIGLQLLSNVSGDETIRVLREMYRADAAFVDDPIVRALYEADNI